MCQIVFSIVLGLSNHITYKTTVDRNSCYLCLTGKALICHSTIYDWSLKLLTRIEKYLVRNLDNNISYQSNTTGTISPHHVSKYSNPPHTKTSAELTRANLTSGNTSPCSCRELQYPIRLFREDTMSAFHHAGLLHIKFKLILLNIEYR